MGWSISRRHAIAHGKSHENVRALQHFGKAALRGLDGEARIVRIHALGAALVNHAVDVAHGDVFLAHAQADVVQRGGQARRTRAVKDHAHLVDFLAHQFQRVQQRRAGDNGRPVLVVVKRRDRHGLPQRLLNVEAFRGLDVFQVDSAAGGLQELAELDDIVGILRAHFQIEDVDIGKALEEHAFAFHHRFGGVRADVAQAQDGRAVGNHRHQVARARCIQRIGRDSLNLFARLGHAGRVGETQIPLGAARFGGRQLQSCPCGPAGDNPKHLCGEFPWLFLFVRIFSHAELDYLAVGGPAAK